LRESEAKLAVEVERLKPFEPRCQELEFKVRGLTCAPWPQGSACMCVHVCV